ncbi:MFS transporter [Aspergillus ambiguus]|uniref:MFS transporter n=1 Tax=Aspergillus ambiguus TaxID=176160 RepID=UPI003CCE2244
MASLQNDDVCNFHRRHKLGNVVDVDVLAKGALIAQYPTNIHNPDVTALEKSAIESEAKSTIFHQTKEMNVIILTTACAAIIQGWQQSTINAASRGWQCSLLLDSSDDFCINTYQMYMTCLTDAAPWISGSIIGTWVSDPLQESIFGRRYALSVSAFFCAIGALAIGSAWCEKWWHTLICRLILGIGIGAKASIAPVFAAEAAPNHLRGRLLMMWQLFDTLGIFVGFLCYWICRRSWEALLGSAAVPSLVLLVLAFLCPESPRFLIRNGEFAKAFISLRQLRGSDIQAAKDLYYIHSQLQIETELFDGQRPQRWWDNDLYQKKVKDQNFLQRVWALFTVQRNRRAVVAAFLVMAAQQLCGINVLSFYSSTLFASVKDSSNPQCVNCKDPMDDRVAWLNLGFGLTNFLFTIPAYIWIDRKGRRILLLYSLGGMFFTLIMIAGFFRLTTQSQDSARIGLVATLIIGVFTLFYGIGAGPVPFTFSAEVFPLAFREVGMSFSVMVNFIGLSLLILFVPPLTSAFAPKDSGPKTTNLLGHRTVLTILFSGLTALAFFLVFFLVPSRTAEISLEEMDAIFVQSIQGRLCMY